MTAGTPADLHGPEGSSTDPTLAARLGRLPGVDPHWSHTVTAADTGGMLRSWHVLDNGVEPSAGTMLCVHGNPTWSYLWRRFLSSAPPGWRVVAVDQLGMGFSERVSAPRWLAMRIDDLAALTEVLGITGRVVIVAHDWGGPVSLGWALAHRDQLAGIILANTGVSLPVGATPPALIRLARSPVLLKAVCVNTPMFVRATAALSRPALSGAVRKALALPYADAVRRRAVGDFVADIPVESDHPSRPVLDAVAAGLETFADVPTLLLWGPRDPVFSERHLRDLLRRLPHADVQRYPRASHLVTEDAPQSAEDTWRWVGDRVGATARQNRDLDGEQQPALVGAPPWAGLTGRAGDPATAVVQLRAEGSETLSFAALEVRVRDLAAGLAHIGVRAGQRVALLVPPGVDLTAAVYACWRVGAVIVVADAGLGLRALGRALRGAGPDHIIGTAAGLAAAAALRVPGRRIAAGPLGPTVRRALGAQHVLSELTELGKAGELPSEPTVDADAAVLFTSGATGPPKGVVYRLSQLRAQLDLITTAYGLTADDRLVAAFAPFALYGPALGIGAAVPDMDVTAPGTLTATALAEAAQAIDATVVFASPAALRNVVATQNTLTEPQRAALARVRLVMSFGAPVPVTLLRAVQRLLPAAELHTPYGMTEVLPVADASLAQIEAAGPGNGVCVGHPLPGVTVQVSPLSALAAADGDLTWHPGVTGEVCVSAAHVKQRYDRLWVTERSSSRTPGWHRTGDVGHLDDEGRLWIEGRLVHVVTTAEGPVTPVGIEQRVEALDGVASAAAVGVGPVGTQQIVIVIVPRPLDRLRSLSLSKGSFATSRSALADPALAAEVRSGARVPVAAVLTLDALPVDIRHASKIDRARVARWAERVLAGGRPGRPSP